MDRKVTLSDIAREAGVSKNTVSLALRNRPGVSDAVRDEILRMAHDMGYEKRGRIDEKRVSTRFILVLVATSIGAHTTASAMGNDGLLPRIFFDLQMKAQQRGCAVIPYVVPFDEEQACAMPPVLHSTPFLGVAVFGALSDDYLRALSETGANIVTVHEYHDGMNLNAVTSDDCYAGYVMTEHLINMGHKHIAYMGEKYYMAKYMDRWQGYCRAMTQHNLPILRSAYSETPIHAQVEETEYRLLDETLASFDPMPTAMVCGEDFTANRVERALNRLGLEVPRDVSLVGFDDVYLNNHAGGRLYTTFRVDVNEMSHNVLDMLVTPQHKPRKVIVYGEPVWRDSVLPLR